MKRADHASRTSGETMKRILILTADYGYGHRSAANAIAEAMHENYGQDCQTKIVNPLDDPRAPAFLREDQKNYNRIVREMPELYSLGYKVVEGRLAGDLFERSWTLILFNILRDIVHQQQPDVIVCTYPFYQGILDAIFSIEKRRIPLLTVITDLATVNRLWFHPAADLCLVPTEIVYDLAVKAGLSPERVKITGIPVRPELASGNQERSSLRSNLGWNQERFTVLAIGSQRVKHLYDSLRVLNHSGFPLQLVVVTGGDHELYERFQETEWHVETHLYDFVSEMGTFMRASDCILSKAGGLTVSEALACGLPLILIDVIPGQETGNANYVVSAGAGELAEDPTQVLEVMSHWLENDRLLYKQRADSARQSGHPQAAFEVAEYIWALSHEDTANPHFSEVLRKADVEPAS
jgi:1,2-diacylglycerol 3-beta-galactosyltransferase